MSDTPTKDDLAALLLALEARLMDPVFRKDRARVSALLAEDFREFGSSGRVWTKDAILEMLVAETDWTAPQIEDFLLQPIAANAVLVTYRTIRSSNQTLRSSIWTNHSGAWRMRFHQGTRISTQADQTSSR